MTESAPIAQATNVRATLVPAELEAIYRAELPYVYRSLQRLGVRPVDIEDLAHDVFIAVHRRFAEYDRARPIRPWLFAFAYRIAADYRRLARHRRERPDHGDEPPDERARPDDQLAEAEGRRRVLAALEGLALDRRAVLVMHDLDGYGIPEVGRALGIPLNTAYSRLRLARRDFEQAIREDDASKGGRTV
jgi:RNA polymerase sigma-70 factor (ECF subfamily)